MTTRLHSTSPRARSRLRTSQGLAIGLSVLSGTLLGSIAAAQVPEQVISNPPEALLGQRNVEGDIVLMAPRTDQRELPGEKFLNLKIDYTESRILNPLTGKPDRVRLRSYTDANKPALATDAPTGAPPFVAPTIRVSPGDTVRISLDNALPPEEGCPTHGDINIPHCFNSTNLHSHGLWVSPMGNSDNVLLTIHPGVKFQYEYNIPADHAAGTFWYHPHLHGSTAVQVASGMAGVLIINGSRKPAMDRNGDVDTLLVNLDGTAFEDRVLLLQQVPYACRDADGKITKAANNSWTCSDDPGDTSDAAIGKVEPVGFDQFTPSAWSESGRFTSINGLTLPTFTGAKVGRPERWRIAHAGVRETVSFQIRKMRAGASAPLGPRFLDLENRWLEENCIGENLAQFAMASDGLTREKIATRTTTVIQPGYREDLLVVFPEPGDYCIVDDSAKDPLGNVNGLVESRKYLGKVTVTGQAIDPSPEKQKEVLLFNLVNAAMRFLPPDVNQKVRNDLSNDLRLTSFVQHKSFSNETLGEQKLEFNIAGGKFLINGEDYDPKQPGRKLLLGAADRWILSSAVASHPFHIHVNPFQVESITNPQGKEVDDATGDGDPGYANLKGVWRDTLFVKQGHTVKVRTRYERYIGNFVLHCHILDHEDKGMMQNVSIGIPDGKGGTLLPDETPHGVMP